MTSTQRLTVGQALVKFLVAQHVEGLARNGKHGLAARTEARFARLLSGGAQPCRAPGALELNHGWLTARVEDGRTAQEIGAKGYPTAEPGEGQMAALV